MTFELPFAALSFTEFCNLFAFILSWAEVCRNRECMVGGGQWGGYGGLRGDCPHFCQDGARDLLKIDEKISVGGGSSKSSEN